MLTQKKYGLMAGFLVIFMIAGMAEAATVTSGWDPDAENLFGVRYRSFANTGGGEVYLGIPDLGNGSNRNEINLNWGQSNDITYSYDPLNRLVSTTVNGSTLTYDFDLGDENLNYMQITLANRDNGTTIEFNDVYLNSESLGSFSGTGWNDWMIKGFDASEGFTLTGTLELDGAFSNSQEKSKLEIKAGNTVPIPGAVWLFASGLAGLMGIRKRAKK
jgi:hypothetical protein